MGLWNKNTKFNHIDKNKLAHALSHVVFLINRMSYMLLSYKTSFTLLFNTISDYDALWTFGCLAYTTSSKRHITKLDTRARKCIYLGNQHGVKGHVLFLSRDTIFVEHLFPDHIQNTKTPNFPQHIFPLTNTNFHDDIDHDTLDSNFPIVQ